MHFVDFSCEFFDFEFDCEILRILNILVLREFARYERYQSFPKFVFRNFIIERYFRQLIVLG